MAENEKRTSSFRFIHRDNFQMTKAIYEGESMQQGANPGWVSIHDGVGEVIARVELQSGESICREDCFVSHD